MSNDLQIKLKCVCGEEIDFAFGTQKFMELLIVVMPCKKCSEQKTKEINTQENNNN